LTEELNYGEPTKSIQVVKMVVEPRRGNGHTGNMWEHCTTPREEDMLEGGRSRGLSVGVAVYPVEKEGRVRSASIKAEKRLKSLIWSVSNSGVSTEKQEGPTFF